MARAAVVAPPSGPSRSRLRAVTKTPTTAMTLISAAPSARPASPPRRSGTARASNSSGPGWWTSTPSASDVAAHGPTPGTDPPSSTSAAPTATSAGSPTGTHRAVTARPAASTTGASAPANATHAQRQASIPLSVPPSSAPPRSSGSRGALPRSGLYAAATSAPLPGSTAPARYRAGGQRDRIRQPAPACTPSPRATGPAPAVTGSGSRAPGGQLAHRAVAGAEVPGG